MNIAGMIASSIDRADRESIRTDWVLSPHAEQQAALKGWDHKAVILAAADPLVTSPNRRYPGQQRRIRAGIVAVCDPAARRIVTVYADRIETDLRADQTDEDATAYGQKRGKR